VRPDPIPVAIFHGAAEMRGTVGGSALPAALPAELRLEAPSICVLIPTLNEAENLPHVLTRIPPEYEVVIVDGRSTDGTAAVATVLRPSARVIEQNGRGKGDAIVCGFAAARSEIIVMLDADGSARVDEIPRFIDALLAGADFAKGSRFLGDGGSADITLLRRIGNYALTRLVNLLFHARYTDLCYGYNAFWADRVAELALDADGFEVETQLNIRACKAGLLVTEVPSFEDTRIHGASNLHAVRDGLRVLRTIIRERFGRDADVAVSCTSARRSAQSLE
jgi:glycosyltransferase involved in cell wall biosynthesis